ncbi:hypothetical protein ACOV63_000317, partial [Neisseria gonorrhoeae]
SGKGCRAQNSGKNKLLEFHDVASFAQSVRNSEARSLWLCGSRSFTSGIAGNLKTRSLHQELFEFRQMNLTRKL